MPFDVVTGEVGTVEVHTTHERGSNPEELAERALNKILYIGENTHPALKEQAEAFKDSIRTVLVFYLKEAVRAHNATIANRLRKAGHEDLIPALDS